MRMFEDRKFTGPLAKYLENCQPYRVEAIYNTEYKYIKEIIWDDELQDKFGNTRAGYDKLKNDRNIKGGFDFGGQTDLRVRTYEDKIIGYMTETKKTQNDDFKILLKQYEDAKKEMYKILKVKDTDTFDYYLENNNISFSFSRSGANETISSIETLEEIITEYNDDPVFKRFLDKIKG